MKLLDRLRSAAPISRTPERMIRPPVETIIGAPLMSPTRTRPRTRGMLLLIVGAAALVAVAAVMALPSMIGREGPLSDSAHYENFQQLDKASSLLVSGTVVSASATRVDENLLTVYRVLISHASDARTGTLDVYIPRTQTDAEPTAETVGLDVGSDYVLALVAFGSEWQLTSTAGQGAFRVSEGEVDRSLDGSLEIDQTTRNLLGVK